MEEVGGTAVRQVFCVVLPCHELRQLGLPVVPRGIAHPQNFSVVHRTQTILDDLLFPWERCVHPLLNILPQVDWMIRPWTVLPCFLLHSVLLQSFPSRRARSAKFDAYA